MLREMHHALAFALSSQRESCPKALDSNVDCALSPNTNGPDTIAPDEAINVTSNFNQHEIADYRRYKMKHSRISTILS